MLRCNNCGHTSAQQYGRHGNKHGFSGCGCTAMSDTEYDNYNDDEEDDDDDEGDWITASQRFRKPTAQDRRFPSHERPRSVQVPLVGNRAQPVPAVLKFHTSSSNGDSSFDAESVLSGTFTIDLGTLQNVQNRLQQSRVTADQPDTFTLPRNRPTHRSRPYSSMSLNDPEPVPYEQEIGFRVPRPYAHVDAHPPHFGTAGGQFRERITDDPRHTYQARGVHRDDTDDHGGRGTFSKCHDYAGCERNPPRYEPNSYNNAIDGTYRYQEPNCASCGYPTDMHHPKGYCRQTSFSNGFPLERRGDGRDKLSVNRDDTAVRQPSLPGNTTISF